MSITSVSQASVRESEGAGGTHIRASRGLDLVVVGVGIQWSGQTTLAARTAIERADRVLFALNDPWAARWITRLNPRAEALGYRRDGRPRAEIYRGMVSRVLEVLGTGARVCAAFYGNPAVLTDPAHQSIRCARDAGFNARMLPGVSSLDCLFADAGIDPGEGSQIFEAADFLRRGLRFEPRAHLVLCQIGLVGTHGPFDAADGERVRGGLEDLKRYLCDSYAGGHQVLLYEAARNPLVPPRMEWLALDALADAEVHEISTLYVPPT